MTFSEAIAACPVGGYVQHSSWIHSPKKIIRTRVRQYAFFSQTGVGPLNSIAIRMCDLTDGQWEVFEREES
jgi:hypothetical protein